MKPPARKTPRRLLAGLGKLKAGGATARASQPAPDPWADWEGVEVPDEYGQPNGSPPPARPSGPMALEFKDGAMHLTIEERTFSLSWKDQQDSQMVCQFYERIADFLPNTDFTAEQKAQVLHGFSAILARHSEELATDLVARARKLAPRLKPLVSMNDAILRRGTANAEKAVAPQKRGSTRRRP